MNWSRPRRCCGPPSGASWIARRSRRRRWTSSRSKSSLLASRRAKQGWNEETLFESFARAWPYRKLTREDFDAVIKLHIDGRHGLLHRDARRRPDHGPQARPHHRHHRRRCDSRCRRLSRACRSREGTFVGTLNEDFAVESNVGDIFQLGNTSWRILKVERGVVRVADAQGQPPSIPFWLGEGASRTAELSAEIGDAARAMRRSRDAAKRSRALARGGGADRRVCSRRPARSRHGADAKARRAGAVFR